MPLYDCGAPECEECQPEAIRTAWDVARLITVTDNEWSPDLDEMTRLRQRKLAALPEIARVLVDISNLLDLLTINSRALRSASREVSAWANCADAAMLVYRVERRAEIARTRLDIGKRLLAARAEREELRGRHLYRPVLDMAAE